jgi:hypothetical protein
MGTPLSYAVTARVRPDGSIAFQDADLIDKVVKIGPGAFEVTLVSGVEAARTCPWVMPWSASKQPAVATTAGVSSLSDEVLSVVLGADVGFCLRLEIFQPGEPGK